MTRTRLQRCSAGCQRFNPEHPKTALVTRLVSLGPLDSLGLPVVWGGGRARDAAVPGPDVVYADEIGQESLPKGWQMRVQVLSR